MIRSKSTRAIWIILLMGLVLRMSIPIVAVYLTPDDRSIFHNKDDTHSYVRPAMGLITEGKFVSYGKPEALRTPGYPLLLVPGLLRGNVELVTVGIQVLLSCLTILLVYGIANVLFNDELVAIFSAGLYAIEPLSLIQTSILQTETVFAFTFAAFMFFLLRYLKYASLLDLFFAALVSAVGSYMRPLAYFMPLVVAVFLFVRALIKTGFIAKPLIYVFLFLLVAMAPVFAWQVRNKIETGHFVFSTIGGKDLYFDAGTSILAYEAGISFYDQKYKMGYSDNEIYFAKHPEQRGWSEVQIVNYQQREAVKIILTHPLQFLRMIVLKTGLTLVAPGLSDWLYVFNMRQQNIDKVLENRRDPWRLVRGPWLGFMGSIFLAGMLAVYWGLAITGLVVRKSYLNEGILLLMMLAAYYVILPAAAGVGYSRFRHPIMPIVCVLAGQGLAVIRRWKLVHKAV